MNMNKKKKELEDAINMKIVNKSVCSQILKNKKFQTEVSK